MDNLRSRQHEIENTITSNQMVVGRYKDEAVTFDEGKAVTTAERARDSALDVYPHGQKRPEVSLETAHHIASIGFMEAEVEHESPVAA